jgi:general stress protein 26
MDSINKQQIESNHQFLEGKAAIDKIRELTEKASTCFFCTNIRTGQPFETRPMVMQKLDEEGNLLFLSAKDSFKNLELEQDPYVQLLFQGSDYSDFLQLYGKARISDDQALIDELWNPMLKTWFTEGKDDPRISVITVKPEEGYYWDTKNNMVVGLMKRLAGAVMGKTMDDSIEGGLKV